MPIDFHERRTRYPERSGIPLGGEGLVYMDFFLTLISGAFILGCFINAIARKDYSFYLWLSFIVLIQTIFTFQLN
jgi:hypothetical protein